MNDPMKIDRVQTGVRIEKRILKVLKSLAETMDISLGDLIEGIALHAFENKKPFSTRQRVSTAFQFAGRDSTSKCCVVSTSWASAQS